MSSAVATPFNVTLNLNNFIFQMPHSKSLEQFEKPLSPNAKQAQNLIFFK